MDRPLQSGKLDPGDESRRQKIRFERMGRTQMNEKVRVALYCRVARADQLAEDAQFERLKGYAAEKNMSIAGAYFDRVPADQPRPGLQQMLRDVAEGQAEMILALTPSRLARRVEQLFEISQRLNEAGATVKFADGSERVLELLGKAWR
ncbi:recombinase family protein [Clostridiaceae bacterium]|nr:recombinase family protein [Clostridiaceae bacterium]